MKLRHCSVAVATILSCSAQAQNEENTTSDESIETIVVTSDFRLLSINELPASATVISADVLQQREATHLEDVFNVAPNINFNSGAGRGRFVQIRGIGERSQFAEPINPSVGFIIDDFDFSGTLGVGTLFDVEQVEVLKGPQGTAFGSSAMAGIIKIKTREADGVESGQVSASIAEKSSYRLSAAYGNAINENWSFRAAFQQYDSDGFVENDFLNRDDTDGIDEFGGRLKLRYEASDNLKLDFAVHYFDVDNGYDAFTLDNIRTSITDEPGFDRQETLALSAKATVSFDAFDLQTSFNTSDSDIDYGYDEDWTFTGFHPFGYTSTDYYFRERDTQTIDIRLNSTESIKLGETEVDWVTGIYFTSTDENLLRQYTFSPSDFTSDYEISSYALYGELYWFLTQKLTLTTGLRLEDSELEYSDVTGFSDSTDETLIGGRIVLDYQMTDDMLLYASINRGYKLGGFNPDERVPDVQRTFEPEYNWNYEAGVKRSIYDGLGFIGLSLFYMDRTDTQISDFATEQVGDTGAVSFIDIIDNADVAKNFGFEFESSYYAFEDFEIFMNLGWLQAEFDGFTNARGDVIPGRDQSQSPDYTFNIGFDWLIDEKWQLRIETDGKDGFFFSDGHQVRSNSYALVHANLSREFNDWSVSVWGKNLFDREYYVRGFGGFSNDPRDGEFGYEQPEPYFQIGDGRMLGVSATYQF